MNITLEDLEEIKCDEETLEKLKEMINQGYAALCSLCDHATEIDLGDDDDEDEEDEDDDIVRSDRRDLVLLDKAIAAINGKGPTDMDLPDKEKFFFEGVEVKDEEEEMIPLRMLFKKIKQASHPDKIMKYSAEIKKQIIDCFHNAKEYYAEDDLPSMVFCYVRVYLLRGEPRRITHSLWKYIKQRHTQILEHLRYLQQRPYMRPIELYFQGKQDEAVRLFKLYLKQVADDPMDDADCFDPEEDDPFFDDMDESIDTEEDAASFIEKDDEEDDTWFKETDEPKRLETDNDSALD